MKSRGELFRRALVVCLPLMAALAMYHPLGLAQDAVVVVGSGSSVLAPLYTKWGQEYNKRNPGTQMRYVPIGTSEGIKLIPAAAATLARARLNSRPLSGRRGA